jgi:hypothetical protein
MRKIKSFILSTAVLIWPVLATAQAPSGLFPSNPGNLLPTHIWGQQATVGGTITGIIQLFLQIAGLIAVFMIIYGGFQYITARGDDKIVAAAKKTLANSIIGLVIIILSYVIIRIIINAAFGHVS